MGRRKIIIIGENIKFVSEESNGIFLDLFFESVSPGMVFIILKLKFRYIQGWGGGGDIPPPSFPVEGFAKTFANCQYLHQNILLHLSKFVILKFDFQLKYQPIVKMRFRTNLYNVYVPRY